MIKSILHVKDYLQVKKVKLRHPGSTTEDMLDYINPLLGENSNA